MKSKALIWTATLCAITSLVAWWWYSQPHELPIDNAATSARVSERRNDATDGNDVINDSRRRFSKNGVAGLDRADAAETDAAEQERIKKLDPCRIVAIDWLKASDDPDDLFTASLLLGRGDADLQPGDRGDALTTIDRAIASSPHDPLLRSIGYMNCGALPGCDKNAYIDGIKHFNSKNMLGLLLELDVKREAIQGAGPQVEKEKDELLEAALGELAKTDRLNLYWREAMQRAARSIASVRTTPVASFAECKAYNNAYAVGALLTLPMPQFAPLVNKCKQSRGKPYLEDCEKISLALQRGDTLISLGLGLAIARGIVVPGSDEDAELTQEWYRFKWLMEQHSLLTGNVSVQQELIEMASQSEWEVGNEIEAIRAVLVEHSIPLEPPRDWKPDASTRSEQAP